MVGLKKCSRSPFLTPEPGILGTTWGAKSSHQSEVILLSCTWERVPCRTTLLTADKHNQSTDSTSAAGGGITVGDVFSLKGSNRTQILPRVTVSRVPSCPQQQRVLLGPQPGCGTVCLLGPQSPSPQHPPRSASRTKGLRTKEWAG